VALADLEQLGLRLQEVVRVLAAPARTGLEPVDLGLAVLQARAEWAAPLRRGGLDWVGPEESVDVMANPAVLKQLLDLALGHAIGLGRRLEFRLRFFGQPAQAKLLIAAVTPGSEPFASLPGDAAEWHWVLLAALAVRAGVVAERQVQAQGVSRCASASPTCCMKARTRAVWRRSGWVSIHTGTLSSGITSDTGSRSGWRACMKVGRMPTPTPVRSMAATALKMSTRTRTWPAPGACASSGRTRGGGRRVRTPPRARRAAVAAVACTACGRPGAPRGRTRGSASCPAGGPPGVRPPGPTGAAPRRPAAAESAGRLRPGGAPGRPGGVFHHLDLDARVGWRKVGQRLRQQVFHHHEGRGQAQQAGEFAVAAQHPAFDLLGLVGHARAWSSTSAPASVGWYPLRERSNSRAPRLPSSASSRRCTVVAFTPRRAAAATRAERPDGQRKAQITPVEVGHQAPRTGPLEPCNLQTLNAKWHDCLHRRAASTVPSRTVCPLT
jgi:hypothetical protein